MINCRSCTSDYHTHGAIDSKIRRTTTKINMLVLNSWIDVHICESRWLTFDPTRSIRSKVPPSSWMALRAASTSFSGSAPCIVVPQLKAWVPTKTRSYISQTSKFALGWFESETLEQACRLQATCLFGYKSATLAYVPVVHWEYVQIMGCLHHTDMWTMITRIKDTSPWIPPSVSILVCFN